MDQEVGHKPDPLVRTITTSTAPGQEVVAVAVGTSIRLLDCKCVAILTRMQCQCAEWKKAATTGADPHQGFTWGGMPTPCELCLCRPHAHWSCCLWCHELQSGCCAPPHALRCRMVTQTQAHACSCCCQHCPHPCPLCSNTVCRTGQHSEMAAEGAHTGAVRFVALSDDGAHLLSGSDDKTAKLWSMSTHQCLATWCGCDMVAAWHMSMWQLAKGGILRMPMECGPCSYA